MSENKKYYWLKLKRDFFKRHDIQIIEDMPNGKEYVLFYLKLLVESIDHDGELRFSHTIPYNDAMLASITKTNIDIVRTAVKIFAELGMMDKMDDGTLHMVQTKAMIGDETQWAEKKRLYRETKEGQKRTLSDKSKILELEKEIDKEKEEESIPPAKAVSITQKNTKHKFGEYQNVLLTDEEYAKIKAMPDGERAIEWISEHIEMKGYKAKSHYLAIRKWVFVAMAEHDQKAQKVGVKVASTVETAQQKANREFDEEMRRRMGIGRE